MNRFASWKLNVPHQRNCSAPCNCSPCWKSTVPQNSHGFFLTTAMNFQLYGKYTSSPWGFEIFHTMGTKRTYHKMNNGLFCITDKKVFRTIEPALGSPGFPFLHRCVRPVFLGDDVCTKKLQIGGIHRKTL